MRRTLLCGLLLAVLAAVTVFVTAWLGFGLGVIAFGAAIGGVLGLVRTHSPLARLAAFLIGFVITWAMFGVQAQFLPQVTASLAICVFVGLALISIIAALSHARLPFWGFLLGAAAIAGAYGVQFQLAPQNFIADSIATVGAVLLPIALGLLATLVIEAVPEEAGQPDGFATGPPPYTPPPYTPPPPPERPAPTAPPSAPQPTVNA